MKDDIKIDNGRYVCTTYLYPGITRVSRSALENFLFLKSYTEYIESYIWYDYERNHYIIRLASTSLTNILRTRFEIVNFYIKAPDQMSGYGGWTQPVNIDISKPREETIDKMFPEFDWYPDLYSLTKFQLNNRFGINSERDDE